MASPKAATIGKQAKSDLPEAVFSEPYNESLVHEAARADMNARRQGTHSSLTRGEVAMTGAKAWRQKGTGRARVGALSVPHRRGGGNAFATKPRNYTFKVNRKARRKALRAALSVHAERDSIAVLPAGSFDEPATKLAAEGLAKWGGATAGPGRHHRRRGGRGEELPQPPARVGRQRPRRRRRRDHRPPLDRRLRGRPRGARGARRGRHRGHADERRGEES